MLNILFVCTGNSARSILAEAILNHRARGRFRAFSAGSHPTGKVHPLAIETLQALAIDPSGARSKSWDEFAGPGAPKLDLVVTVCDDAAGEACPAFTGAPAREHWGVADPAAVPGTEDQKRLAYRGAAAILESRIERFLAG